MFVIDKDGKGSGIIINPATRDYSSPLSVVVGVDAGSTQTRVCIADKRDVANMMSEVPTKDVYDALREQVYIIPSTYAVVADEREISANSRNLEDNYDSHIILVKNQAIKPLVVSGRIVRGQKIRDAAGLVSRYLDSSTNKMDNTIFYTNVIDGIGYALLRKYSGNIPTNVSISLVLSVRPKELNKFCTDKMNENFKGDFIFRWKDVSIQLHITDIIYTTEPEAQITGTRIVMDVASVVCHSKDAEDMSNRLSNSDSYIHIEGGGSSIGVEVVKNGNIVDACSSTFQLGGNYLVRVVMDRLREVKGRVVSEESVQSAIRTCLLKNGREREDISSIIATCKNQVGLDIMERLRHDVIDITPDLNLLDMDFITLGGRLFSEDESGGSIGLYFSEYVKQLSPNTEVIILKDNYIPQGNMVIGINEFDLSKSPEPPTTSVVHTPTVATADDDEDAGD